MMPRFKFLERGLGIRKKVNTVLDLIDQRRLDGIQNQKVDKVLGKTRQKLRAELHEPARVKGKNFNKATYSRKELKQT